jgi:hypothetical protein
MRHRWTDADKAWLGEHYSTIRKPDLLAHFPDCSFTAIQQQAKKLGRSRLPSAVYGQRTPFRRPLTEVELAYIAGIIDGEGHISIRRSKRPKNITIYQPVVGLTNQSEDLIFWMDERIAWTRRNLQVDKTGWGWAYKPSILGHSIVPLLEGMLPYLVIKADRALLVLEFCASRAASPINSKLTAEQIAIADKVRSLNAHRQAPTSALPLLGRSSLTSSMT